MSEPRFHRATQVVLEPPTTEGWIVPARGSAVVVEGDVDARRFQPEGLPIVRAARRQDFVERGSGFSICRVFALILAMATSTAAARPRRATATGNITSIAGAAGVKEALASERLVPQRTGSRAA